MLPKTSKAPANNETRREKSFPIRIETPTHSVFSPLLLLTARPQIGNTRTAKKEIATVVKPKTQGKPTTPIPSWSASCSVSPSFHLPNLRRPVSIKCTTHVKPPPEPPSTPTIPIHPNMYTNTQHIFSVAKSRKTKRGTAATKILAPATVLGPSRESFATLALPTIYPPTSPPAKAAIQPWYVLSPLEKKGKTRMSPVDTGRVPYATLPCPSLP